MSANLKKTLQVSMLPGIFTEAFKIKPLAPGALSGFSFAVKDAIDICGYKSGCGNPLWFKTHPIATINAACANQLLSSGATCYGKTIMGELGCGLTGINSFFEAVPNPRFLAHLPGGSSSGSAAAVATGIVDFSLGVDAGGSVRVPASYCGIFGMRPSQGMISLAGVNYLSPSFDTVGIFANNIEVITKVLSLLLPINFTSNSNIKNIYILSDCFDLLEDDLKNKFYSYINLLKKQRIGNIIEINCDAIDSEANDRDKGWSDTFKTIFCNEAWDTLGLWVKGAHLEYGKTTYTDFSNMIAGADRMKLNEAVKQQETQFHKINSFLGPNSLLCIPTTPDIAPTRKGATIKEYQFFRKLISISGVGKLPQISVPLFGDKLPIGLSFIGAHGSDFHLLAAVSQLKEQGLLDFG